MDIVFRMVLFSFVAVPILGMYLFQDSLLYHPDTFSLPELLQRVKSSTVKVWPEANENYRGFLSISHPADARGTIVVFHGNAGSAVDRQYYVNALVPLGYRVLLAEYPKYGARTGSLGERNLVSDAAATLKAVRQAFSGPLYVWGESLGCAVATGVAADKSLDVNGVVLITPWNNLPDLAQALYWFLPAKWMVRDRYDNVANLKDFKKPVALLMAGEDEIIPNKHTLAFYEAVQSPKRLWVFQAAYHNTWPMSPTEKWWGEVVDFSSTGSRDTP